MLAPLLPMECVRIVYAVPNAIRGKCNIPCIRTNRTNTVSTGDLPNAHQWWVPLANT